VGPPDRPDRASLQNLMMQDLVLCTMSWEAQLLLPASAHGLA
jgi:hypothetical protein